MQKIRVLIFTDFWNKSPEILAIGVSGLQIQYVVRWPGNPPCVWFKFLHNKTSTKTNKIERKALIAFNFHFKLSLTNTFTYRLWPRTLLTRKTDRIKIGFQRDPSRYETEIGLSTKTLWHNCHVLSALFCSG